MPVPSTDTEQRLAWRMAHQKNYRCRPMPAKLSCIQVQTYVQSGDAVFATKLGEGGSADRSAMNVLESLFLILMAPLSRPSLASVTRPEPDRWSYSQAPSQVNDTPVLVGLQFTLPRTMSGIRGDLNAAGFLAMCCDAPKGKVVLDCFGSGPSEYEFRRKISDSPRALARFRSTCDAFGRFLRESGMLDDAEEQG